MIDSPFLIRPFSVLNANSKEWRTRRSEWMKMGVNDTAGREFLLRNISSIEDGDDYISAFDPVLAECAYRWFCKPNGNVLDPFCGGMTRGFVALSLGLEYTGIDIRKEQVESNIQQCNLHGCTPEYIAGDSESVLDQIRKRYDLIFSCPPYYNLEVYSSLEEDLSNQKTYQAFLDKYSAIIAKCCSRLKLGGYAVFVVGDVRGKDGSLFGFVKDTISIFQQNGLQLYNEAVIYKKGTDSILRINSFDNTRKMVRIHQNMLVFGKELDFKNKIEKQIERYQRVSSLSKEELMKAMERFKG